MISTFESNSLTTTTAVEMEITAVVHSFHAALIDADKESLESFLYKDLSYGHSSGVVENKNHFIENIMNRNSVFLEIEATDINIKTAGDTAIARYTFNAKTNDNNVPAIISLMLLLVLQKQNEQWKLLARQAVRM